MHHIILNTDKIVPLQQYIDNTNSDIKVGLRSIMYNIGWYNINYETVKWIKGGTTPDVDFIIQPGLYNFNDLQNILINTTPQLKLHINKSNGIAVISVPKGYDVHLTDGLKQMLGIMGNVFSEGTHIGSRPINFSPLKSLYIHLNQVNTTDNFYNGVQSDLIGVVPVGDKTFGDTVNVHYEHPEFRNLADGTISELEIRVTDENNNIIENHGLPISIVLEFI